MELAIDCLDFQDSSTFNAEYFPCPLFQLFIGNSISAEKSFLGKIGAKLKQGWGTGGLIRYGNNGDVVSLLFYFVVISGRLPAPEHFKT